jgi:NADH:ubiquinone reductase (H+-translocating)
MSLVPLPTPGTQVAGGVVMDAVRPQVLIVGGGFGGLAAARALKHAPVDVTVLDRENYHLFQPLLYQVATAELSETDVATSVREVLAGQRNARVVLGEVSGVDLDRRCVMTDVGEIPYDFLVLATGAEPNYYGRDEWESRAPSPKSLLASLEIRRRVITALELAESIEDPMERRLLLEFVIVGGGPTGVEFAGALADGRGGLTRMFKHIEPGHMRVHLANAQSRVLPTFPEDLSKKAAAQLERRGVVLHLGRRVTEIDDTGVSLDDGSRLEAATVIWTAGVRPAPLAHSLPGEHPHGRVAVTPDLSLPGHPEVFAIGDMAHFEEKGAPLPAVSPVAMQQGRAVARSIRRTLQKRPREPFHYWDKGSMAQIGHYHAIAQVGRLHLGGIVPWFMWGLVHLYYLSGLRNQISVMFSWIWFFLTRQRASPIVAGTQHPIAVHGRS